ncbi:MAG TPA: tetratricopeptide repeat protein [Candidatus Angelobacter sp.]|nr:tetratricopeptide repeat protein [Candidatus Angelobacter sp.]
MMASALITQAKNDIPESLLRELKEHLVGRRVSSGFALLDRHAQVFADLDPAQPNAAALAGHVAQWVDIGYSEPELVEQLLARFPPAARRKLSVGDYLQLRMAEGLLALLRDRPDEALRHFDLVLSLQDEIEDKESVAIAHFWNGRCHRKKGEYDEALKRSAAGRELAQSLGYEKMAAVMRVLESWLHFQKGQRREAARILDQAEAVLRATDDDITLGNIYSAHGRMVRRQGSYGEALKFFSRAIEHFRKRNPQHRNLARSLTNIAYVQRLIALQISKQMDTEAERRRKSQAKNKDKGAAPRSLSRRREEYEQHRSGAFANLEQAEKIYRHHNHHHGIGSVLENRGLLYFDSGDLESADEQAAQAYALGQAENDSILVARARLLQCEVSNARLEEEMEGWEHAQAARDYARQAVEAAKHTQNHRLLARTYIWRGLTACYPAIHDAEDAKHCCDRAGTFIKAGESDDLWEELQLLRHKVTPRGAIDPQLRAWSQGVTGDKTFQELAEDFAELVIPRVWEKEGKKVQRVAARLKVSPKKVRRILARAGKRKQR